ncbi:MAG: hypothetical protein AB7N65_26390, partial [Vicinamibacterales bacterium]
NGVRSGRIDREETIMRDGDNQRPVGRRGHRHAPASAHSVRRMWPVVLLAIAVATLTVQQLTVAAQNGTRAGAPPASRGRPDFHGNWKFSTVTPLQRPAELAGKARFESDEEAKAYAKRAALNLDRDPPPGDPGTYNQFWIDAGDSVTKSLRTSLIVDPPDGRIPALTPEAQKRLAATVERTKVNANPEDRSLYERCILGFNAGPPIIPGPYNNIMQIVQTDDYVGLITEMVHDARLVPVKGITPPGVPQWKGNSTGRWEGDTLVIESQHFRADGTGTISFRPATDGNLRLTERLRLLDRDTLEYQFTVDDPTVWTKPWTAIVEMSRTGEQIFEFACHEGNHAMIGMLGGARAQERAGLVPR